jgi:hypothetical protein
MTFLLWLVIALLLFFGLVVLSGAPYLPTLHRQRHIALELLNLKKGQMLVDLGCGDGSILLAAARQGLVAVGYEINPLLAGFVWLRTRPYRRQVRVVWGSFWRADISQADGVFVFLIENKMAKLDRFISRQVIKPLKVVSHGFTIPGRRPLRQREALFLYHYQPGGQVRAGQGRRLASSR